MKISKLSTNILIIASLLGLHFSAQATDVWDTYSDTWVAVDELGRTVNSSETGLSAPKENKSVGMFYYICNGPHGTNGDPIYDITEILKENPSDPVFGPEGKPHWWCKPNLGYYVNTDAFVYDKHLQLLCDAGIDFLFMDVTNAFTYDNAVKLLMEAIDRRTDAGMRSPKLVYTLNSQVPTIVSHLWSTFYSKPEYDKYWFYYNGKPLMLVDPSQLTSLSKVIQDHFTTRHSWAWMGGANPDTWGWLENYPQNCGWTYYNGIRVNEQISVSTAQHATSKIGKSFHNGSQPTLDQYAVCKDTPLGLYFDEQWRRAFQLNPPIVMITQFNECMAGRFIIKTQADIDGYRPGGKPKIGESMFVDAYNAEFNRDIEPSTHPLIRDNYYQQMVSNVRKYKGVRSIPIPSQSMSINLNGDMTQWEQVTPEFRDDIGDITHRDTKGFQDVVPMKNISGRNDIICSKVTKDISNIYFYVKTAANFSNFNFSKQWMMLFLNTDCNYNTGWSGYDYAVMKNPSNSKYYLMKSVFNNYSWSPIAEVQRFVKQNEMYFALKCSDLKINNDNNIDFKWADNTPEKPDILDFYNEGDVAPNGRFNYRYKGSVVPSSVDKIDKSVDINFNVVRNSRDEISISYSISDAEELFIDIYNLQGSLIKSFNNISEASNSFTCEVPNDFLIIKAITNSGYKAIKIP